MRTIAEIKADIANVIANLPAGYTNTDLCELEAELRNVMLWNIPTDELEQYAQARSEGRVVVLPKTGIGDLSDGYHTFNELYDHRAVLFSVICNCNPEKAWKSKQHHDGTMYDDMFIVGFETPYGQATYHYSINPYWRYFTVNILDKAPPWDGHTASDAINRLLNYGTREAAENALRGADDEAIS